MKIFGLALTAVSHEEAKAEIAKNLPIQSWHSLSASGKGFVGILSREIGNLASVEVMELGGMLHVGFYDSDGEAISVDTAIFAEQGETTLDIVPSKPSVKSARKSRVEKVSPSSMEDWDRLIKTIDQIFKEKL